MEYRNFAKKLKLIDLSRQANRKGIAWFQHFNLNELNIYHQNGKVLRQNSLEKDTILYLMLYYEWLTRRSLELVPDYPK